MSPKAAFAAGRSTFVVLPSLRDGPLAGLPRRREGRSTFVVLPSLRAHWDGALDAE